MPTAAKKPAAKKPAAKPAAKRAAPKPAAKKAAPAKKVPVKKPAPAKKAAAKKPAAKPAAKPAGLWHNISTAFTSSSDPAAVGAALLPMLAAVPGELHAQLAKTLGAQFTRATAQARKRALRAGIDGIEAAQEILNTLKVYASAAGTLRERGEEILKALEPLPAQAQRQAQAALSQLTLAVTREKNLFEVPALMNAAIARVLAELPKVKGKKK